MGYKRQHASRLSAEKEASVEDTPFPANFLRGVKVVLQAPCFFAAYIWAQYRSDKLTCIITQAYVKWSLPAKGC